MRWLSRTIVSALAIGAAVNVEAQCVTSTVTPNQAVTPNTNALTMFVLDTTTGGSTTNSALLIGKTGITDGLLAADALCTHYAQQSSQAKGSYNRGADGQTVQFTALLSSTAVAAASRITPGVNIQSYSSTNGYKCLASSVSDLFRASDGLGYNMQGLIFNEHGAAVGANVGVWTSIGIPTAATGSAATATAEDYGGRFHPAGAPPGDYSTLRPNYYCTDYTSSSSSQSGVTGLLNPSDGGAVNRWLLQGNSAFQSACNSGFRLYCLSAQPFTTPTVPGGTGDPQFTGLQGQSFQVHGMPDEFFNLITTPTFQLNSRFTYIASGTCNYNNTECWTHPGTYVDQLGFMFPGLNIKAVAGPHHKGLRVWINDEEMHRSRGALVLTTTTGVNATTAGEVSISHPHHDVLVVSSSLFTVEVTNSDWFFNFNLLFHAPEVLAAGRDMHFIHDSRAGGAANKPAYIGSEVYPIYPMHGLVGQTWKNARYPGKRMYQGEVDDYMLLDHQLFSKQFLFNLYSY